jgi:alpha-beta hydrolase superfamily lysophospholipase
MESPNHYSGMLMDFAARGYLVFAQFHEDRSCSYTEKLDGTPMHIQTGFGEGQWLQNKEKMTECMDIRTRELSIAYYEIEKSTNEFRERVFGPEISNNVILAGHSLGGNSAYLAARELGKRKVKAMLLFDPCITILDPSYQYLCDVPMFSINSENFPI